MIPAAPSPPRTVAPSHPGSFMRGALRVFDLSLGEMLWSRRTVFLAGLAICGAFREVPDG